MILEILADVRWPPWHLWLVWHLTIVLRLSLASVLLWSISISGQKWNSARLKNIFLYMPLRYIVEFITHFKNKHKNLFLATVCLNLCWHFSSSSIVLFWKRFIVVPREKTIQLRHFWNQTSFEFLTKYLLIYEPYIYFIYRFFSADIFANSFSHIYEPLIDRRD